MIQLLPKQQEFVFDLKSPIVGYIGGFGAGKTLGGSVKGIVLSGYNEGCAGMLVSPTYPMLRDTTRRTFLEVLEQENIGFTFRATENRVIIHETNSEVWFRSADDPNKLKGSNLAWVGLDEPGLMDKEAYLIALSRIRDPKANARQLFLTGTPEGFNWLYEEVENNPEGKKIIRASSKDNKFLPPEYIKTLLNNYDEQLAKQYIDGEFVLLNKGQVYYSFSRNHNLIERTYDPNYPIILCVDFNVTPSCYALIQNIRGIDYIIDEIVLRNSNTELACKTYRERYRDASTYIYGDYSGNQRHTSSSTTDYEIIKNIINPIDIKVKPNPPIVDRINAVNSRLKNAIGERRLFVNPKCKTVIKDFEQVIYKEGKREIDKSNLELTHISDAIGYYIEYEYSLKGKPSVTHMMDKR